MLKTQGNCQRALVNDDSMTHLSAIEPASTRSGDTAHGVIVNLPAGWDFGFIKPDEGGENIFFHASMVCGEMSLDDLAVGDDVQFKVGENHNTGQPIAMDVSKVVAFDRFL